MSALVFVMLWLLCLAALFIAVNYLMDCVSRIWLYYQIRKIINDVKKDDNYGN